VRSRTQLRRLARDLVAFLNGQRGMLRAWGYSVPWYLLLMPVACLGVPAAGIPLRLFAGGIGAWGLWGGIGLVLAVLCWALARQMRWRPRTRLAAAGGVGGAGYLFLFGAMAFAPVAPSPIDARAWKWFAPVGASYRVLMPRVPSPQHGAWSVTQWGTWNSYVLDLKQQDVTFTVSHMDVSRADLKPDTVEKLWEEVTRVTQRTSGATLVSHRQLSRYGQPGREFVFRLLGRNGDGTLVVHAYVIHGRLFTASVASHHLRADAPEVRRFLDSFEPDTAP
jgi:hypothetical protein